MRRVRCDERGAKDAARIIAKGGVVVFPTDTVYGIGCDPYNASAVQRIYRIKGRDPSKPLPVLAHSSENAARIAEMNGQARRLAAKFWPGKLTMILKAKDAELERVMGLSGTVAVRVPGGRCVQAILEICGYLAGTSANASGGGSISDPARAESIECDIMVDGGAAGGIESTIIDLSGGEIKFARIGAVAKDEIGGAL